MPDRLGRPPFNCPVCGKTRVARRQRKSPWHPEPVCKWCADKLKLENAKRKCVVCRTKKPAKEFFTDDTCKKCWDQLMVRCVMCGYWFDRKRAVIWKNKGYCRSCLGRHAHNKAQLRRSYGI